MIIILSNLCWLNVSPTMSSKASRDAPATTRAGQTTLYNERETWACFRLSLSGAGRDSGDSGGHWGTLGDTGVTHHYYTGCVGSLNQYEIASFMRVVSCHRLLYLAETCQLVWPGLSLKFCLQIPVGHNQDQTWDLLGSYQISLSDRLRHSQLTVGRIKNKLESVGISNLPETDFYVTTKVFILSSSRQHISTQQLWLSTTLGYFYKVRGGRKM